MSRTAGSATDSVPPEEVERRMAEYRRQGWEHQAVPHAMYEAPYILCPWPGCGYRIAAVDFHVERMGDPSLYKQVLSAWWQGPGVVGRCPGCGNYVLFSMGQKQTVNDPTATGYVVLPDSWHQTAYIIQ